jgi:SAM-dependent methyltransferase
MTGDDPLAVTGAAPACFCGSTRYRALLEGGYDRLALRNYDFTVVRCLDCGLARTLPVPDVSQYERGYSLTTENGRFVGARADAWSEAIAEYVWARTSGKRLLDIGCHVGNLVVAAEACGFAAEGIDLDPVATEEARRLGRRVHTGRVEDLEGSYDAVVMNQVLEHVLDLRSFLSAVVRLLAPGGRFFVFVPYYAGLVPILMGRHWIGWAPRQHVWHFTPATLTSVMHDATPLRRIAYTTKGVIEPPSTGAKGAVKARVSAFSRLVEWGDQIEAIFEKPPERRG